MKSDDIIRLLKNKKVIVCIAVLAVVGAVLMIYGGREKNTAPTDEISEYTAATENKIEQTVKALCGGDALVIVTAEYGKETQYAKNISKDSEQTVLSSGQPVAVRTVAPTVRGISIVCKNGDDPVICRRITEALSTAYGISSAKIYVAPMK